MVWKCCWWCGWLGVAGYACSAHHTAAQGEARRAHESALGGQRTPAMTQCSYTLCHSQFPCSARCPIHTGLNKLGFQLLSTVVN